MAMGVKRVFAHKKLSLTASAAIAAAALGSSATISSAAITVNGSWSADFGSALTTQTINTSFGDSAYSGTYNGHSGDTNGSELDAGYGVIENGYLYLLLTGDMEDNGNHLNIFIADGRTGQSTLAAGMGQTLDTINGSEFSPNFGHGATYALDVNIANGSPTASPNVYMNYYNLFAGANVNGYAGSFSVNGTTNDSPNTETGFIEAFNDSHVSTMGTADAAAGTNADSLTGYEVAIPLTSLGDPTGTIEVMAGVNGGGDNGFSNQFLAGLPVGSGNVKNSLSPFYLSSNSAGFNFSTTAGIFFTVPAAATPTLYWAGSGTVTTGDHKTWDINTNQNWQSGGTGYVYADGSSVIFDDTGSPNANVTLNTTVNPGSVTFNNNSVSYVISGTGSIAGSTNLVKGGSGQVTLSTANTYTGGTNINDGTLIVGNAAAIPTGSSLTISDGSYTATLDLNGIGATVGSLTSPVFSNSGLYGIVTNNGAQTATLTYNGTRASDTNSEIEDGSSFTAVTVTSGSLELGGALSYSGTTTITTGANLQIAGTPEAVAATTDDTLAGNVTGGGNLTVGDGDKSLDLTLNGALTYTGTTKIDSNADLIIGTASSISSSSIGVFGNLDVSDSTTFTVGGGTAAQTLTGAHASNDGGGAENTATIIAQTLAIGANGTLKPDDPSWDTTPTGVADLTVNGSVDLTNGGLGGGTLLLQVDPDKTATNDQLAVINGLVTFGGILDVTASNADPFKSGDSYILINSADGFSGAFTTVDLPTPGANQKWVTTITSSEYIITILSPTLYWNNASGNNLWDINSSTNWNDITDAINPAVYTEGDAVNFADIGGTSGASLPASAYNVTLNTTVNPSSVVVNNSAGNYVISGTGSIAGSTSLVKEGTDSFTLSTTNTYTGGTTIGQGTLIVGNAAAIPVGSTVTFGDGTNNGTLDLGGVGATVGNLVVATGSSGTITNNGTQAAALIFNGSTSATTTFSGAIQDGSSKTGLTVGTGTLDLTGTLSYSGTTTITSGLEVGGTNANTLNGNFTGAGFLTVGDGNTNGSTLTLNGVEGYTGTTQVNSYATLGLGTGVSSISSSSISVFGTLTPAANTFTIGGGSAAQTLTGGLYNAGTPGAGEVGAVIINGGTGTLTVGANGTLAPGNPGNATATLNVHGNVNLLGGGSTLLMQVNPDTTGKNDELMITGNATLAGLLDVTGVNADAFTLGETYTLITANNISGSFSTVDLPTLTAGFKWDTTDTLTNYIIYVAVSSGESTPATLYWNNASTNNLWDNTSANWNDITDPLNPATYADTDPVNFTDVGGTSGASLPAGAYNVTLNTTVKPDSVSVNNSAGNYVISGTGSIAGSTSLVKEGSDSLTLSTANSYTGGTTIGNGTLIVGNSSAIPTGSSVTFGDGTNAGTLDLGGIGATVGSLATATSGSGTITNNGGAASTAATLTFAGGTSSSSTFTGAIQNGSANTALTVNSGTLTLNGTNTYSGVTSINGGTLALGAAGSIADSSLITVAGGATFNVSAVSGGFTLGGSTAQELNGNGNVIGNVTVGAQGNLSPGDAVGPLSVTGNVSLGGTLSAQVDPDESESPPNDQLSATGNVSLGGALTVTKVNSDPLTNGESYTLINASGGIQNGSGVQTAFSSVSLPALNAGLSWNTTMMNDNPSNYQDNYTVSVVNTVPTGFTLGAPIYTAAISHGQSYNGYYIQHVSGAGSRQTDVQFLGGTVSAPTGTTLSVQFANASPSNGDFISDVATIIGTNSDMYVLELSYNSSLVTNGTLSPVLAMFNSTSHQFESASLSNTSDSAHQEVTGAYSSADFTLGDYGVDPTNHEVWAVLNYSAGDQFGVYQRIPGDLTGIGTVTLSDLGLVQTNLNQSNNGLWSAGDFQGNGSPTDTVTLGDLSLTQSNLNATEPIGNAYQVGSGLITSSPVPEPGSLVLLAVGGLGMMLRGRRKKA